MRARLAVYPVAAVLAACVSAYAAGDAAAGGRSGGYGEVEPERVRPPTQSLSYTGRLLMSTRVFARPAEEPLRRLAAQTPWTQAPLRLLILSRTRTRKGRPWARVALPYRDLTAGWVRADRLAISANPWRVVIDRGRRVVEVLRAGRPVRRFAAVVGKRATPTPLGRFAVLEHVRVRNPEEFLGPWSLHLTATSRVLRRFDGANGRVAIHGRAGTSLQAPLGSASSHGCVRVDNDKIRYLARGLPDGTPVRIHR